MTKPLEYPEDHPLMIKRRNDAEKIEERKRADHERETEARKNEITLLLKKAGVENVDVKNVHYAVELAPGRVYITPPVRMQPAARKRSAEKIIKAIDKIQGELRKLRLSRQDGPALPPFTDEELEQWRLEVNAFVVESDLSAPSRRSEVDPDQRKRREAVKCAARLLKECDLELKDMRTSLFHKIALILYGDRNASLQHLLKVYIAEAK